MTKCVNQICLCLFCSKFHGAFRSGLRFFVPILLRLDSVILSRSVILQISSKKVTFFTNLRKKSNFAAFLRRWQNVSTKYAYTYFVANFMALLDLASDFSYRFCFAWNQSFYQGRQFCKSYMMLLYSIGYETLSEHELAGVDGILIIWIPDNEKWKRYKVVVPLSLSSLMPYIRTRCRFCTPTLDTFVYDVTLLHRVWNPLWTWISRKRWHFDKFNTR